MPERSPSGAPDVANAPSARLHDVLNELPLDAARRALASCCGAARWVDGMLAQRPFASTPAVYAAAERVFRGLGREDHLEAFRHHPAIGAAAEELGAAGDASRREQAGLANAGASLQRALREANAEYRALFGYVFLVFATGKSGEEMLELLRARLANDPDTELLIAAEELLKITILRLQRLAP